MQQSSDEESPPPPHCPAGASTDGAGIVVSLETETRTRRIRINKWRVSEGQNVAPAQILFLYQEVDDESIDNDDDCSGKLENKTRDIQKYKSTYAGVVRKRLRKECDLVLNGDPLLELSECLHTTVMRDMCADCGADLQQNGKGKTSEASVPMVHTMPDLKVTQKLAQKLGHDDTCRLLSDRKLVLLVDLDQTIIHTTNDPVPGNLKGIYHFQLYGPQSPWYHTCLRPGTAEFLERMSQLYELHICTFGARKYAHMIAELLDPKGKLFSHRILSRDECFNATSKMDNLMALFPNGDSMVCIIDDREDVWNMATNLIQVKPYHFFQHTGDINAPPDLSQENADDDGDLDFKGFDETIELKRKEKQRKERNTKPKNEEKKSRSLKDICDSLTKELREKSNVQLVDTKNVGTKDFVFKIPRPVSKREDEEASASKLIEVVIRSDGQKSAKIDIEDPDNYLVYLEVILRNIYKRFYAIYDETQEIPDLKIIVPKIRSEVLRGQNLVFSGLVPTQTKLEQSRAFFIAKSLGAEVHANIGKDTTHLVAANPGTHKVNAAKKEDHIKVVNANWLWACAERWEHVDEKLFPLECKSHQPPASHCVNPEKIIVQNDQLDCSPSCSKQQQQEQSENFRETLNPLLLLSNADLDSMNKDYDNFFESEGSDSSDPSNISEN